LEGSTDTALPTEPSLSRRTSAHGSTSSLTRRRSLVQTPGVATRNSSIEGRRKTWNSWKAPQVGPEEEAKWAVTPKGITPLNRLKVRNQAEESPKGSGVRARTPSEMDYGHLGSLKLGTLSIVNGAPSPAASTKLSRPMSTVEVTSDYFTAEASPLMMKDTRRRGHVKSKSLNVNGHDANRFAQDYQAYIPDSPFASTTTFAHGEQYHAFSPEENLPSQVDTARALAGTAFDAPTTAIEMSGSSLFSTAPRVAIPEKQPMRANRRPAPRTTDSGYSSGGSLRTNNHGRQSANSMNSARSSDNSVQEAHAISPALSRDSRESHSPAGFSHHVQSRMNEVETRQEPAILHTLIQHERPSTSESLLSPSSVASKSSGDSTSSSNQKRLQKRRPSQPELPVVHTCQSIPEGTIPDIPSEVRIKFERRLSHTPEMECLTNTYPTKDHVLAAQSDASTVSAAPVEPVVPLKELEPEQPPAPPAHKRHRSLSLFRRKSTVESRDADKEDGNTALGVVDLGTIASSLGSSPYDAAMSGPQRKTVTSPTHPHQLGGTLPRAKSMVSMDSQVAAEFARMRSKDRALAEQEIPQLSQQRRRSHHNLKTEVGEAKASKRRQNYSVHDIPPVPIIDASRFKAAPHSARLRLESEAEPKTDLSFNARAQAKGEQVSQLVVRYDQPQENLSMPTLSWDEHARHWNQRRKSIGEGLRPQASFGEASASSVNSRNMPPPPRVDVAAWGRYSGGLDYNYEGRGAGVGGSAGTRSLHSKASSKSMQWRHQYGVDLSDVPIVLQRA
jgi:hypothetical protein